jgi:hypothetical protein
MSRDFLGRGWRFPVETDNKGDVELSSEERDIEESVRIILGTARGERVMRPDFGCDIHDYVFASASATTLALVETSVREALLRWEPRIAVENVDASNDRVERGRLEIRIDYRVRSSNAERNLVYPFYVGGASTG